MPGGDDEIIESNPCPSGVRVAADYTAKQGQYLAFIYAYTKVNRRPPAQTDIQRFFRVTPPSVHNMILTLERNRPSSDVVPPAAP